MSSIYDKASLVLIPSGTKTSKVYSQKPVNGDGDFTFSRSTAATRVNADGNIEKETQNLLLQSNSFDTTWGNSSTTETSGQSGYDGTNNAWLLSKSAASGYIVQFVSVSGVQTFSVYVKANASTWGLLQCIGGSNPYAYFNLDTGVVGSIGGGTISSSIEDVGGDWYRISMIHNTTISSARIYPAESNTASGTSGSIYIQDAQLEQGLVARDYIETTTAAVEGGMTDNVPRLDYTDSSCPALLLEPQRTNVATHSEYFGAWDIVRATSVANSSVSPDGTSNAYKLEANVTSSNGSWFREILSSFSGNYEFSVFAKAGTTDFLQLRVDGTGGVVFDLSDGTIKSEENAVGSVLDYGNGWYRCSIQLTASSSTTLLIIVGNENMSTSVWSSTNGDSVYLYGAMLEAGSYATSYIPTYGTSVTRNGETLQLTGMSSDVASGATSGTLMVEFDYTQQSFGDVVQWYSSNTSQGRGYLYNRSLGFADTWGSAGLGTTDGVNTKVIWRLDSLSSGTFFKDGVKGNDVDTTTQAWNNIDNLFIRGHYGTINVRQIIFVPYALTNEAAIDLTTL